MKRAYAWGMFGQFGAAADPYWFNYFCQRVAAEGIDTRRSPYQNTDTNIITEDIRSTEHEDCVRFVFGASLGACNSPLVVKYAHPIVIHGIFGFQPSLYGIHQPIEGNCDLASFSYTPDPLSTFPLVGFGAQQWTLAAGNNHTKLIPIPKNQPHTGDYDLAVQRQFLALMRKLRGADENVEAAGSS